MFISPNQLKEITVLLGTIACLCL